MRYIYDIGKSELVDTTVPVGTQLDLFKEEPTTGSIGASSPGPVLSKNSFSGPGNIKQTPIGFVKTIKPKIKEKPTYPFDTPQGIDHVTKTLKEDYGDNLNSKDQTNLNILNKEMKLSVLKDELGGLKKYNQYDKTSLPYDPEQKRRLKNISSLEKSLGYNSPENNVPYKKDIRTPNQKKADSWEANKKTVQQLNNLKEWGQNPLTKQNPKAHYSKGGTAKNKKFDMWNDGIKTDKSPHNIAEVRKIVNEEVKRNGTKFLTPDELKYIDKKVEAPSVPSSPFLDTSLELLEARPTAHETPIESFDQFYARREHERKEREFNENIKTGIGPLFKIHKRKFND